MITLGRGSHREHLLVPEDELRRRGIEVHEIGRGGDVTYHGPGQLVGYPIVALAEGRRDLHAYVRALEDALIRAVGAFGVRGSREAGLTGVWVGRRKIAALGVRVSTGWVTSHGFALNVAADLSGFDAIVPCGLRDRGVTSLALECGRDVPLPEAAARAAVHVAEVLGLAAAATARLT